MKLRFYALFLTCMFSFSTQSLIGSEHTDPIKDIFTDRWKYIEYIFVLQPKKKLNTITLQLKLLLPALIVSSATGIGCYTSIERYVPDNVKKFKSKTFLNLSAIPLLSLLSGLKTHKLLKKKVKSHIEYHIIKHFIAQWPINKQYSPEPLHSAFDKLYEHYCGSTQTFKNMSHEVFYITKRMVYEHFSDRYEKHLIDNPEQSLKYMFYNTLLSCDVTKCIELIIDIISNFF